MLFRKNVAVSVRSTGTPYTHTTFAQAISALSLRLNDPNGKYWTQEEKGSRIVQALRMWQALTSTYRERATFSIESGDVILDLHDLIPERFGFHVTDQDAVKGIQYSLLEPATGNSWTGSPQFTLAEVSNSLQRRRNQFLLDTGMVLTYSLINVPPQTVSRVALPDGVIDIRRVAWIDAGTGNYTPVFRDDEFSALSFASDWEREPGVPTVYSSAVTPPASLQLIPPPADKGALELVTVNTGPDLDPTTHTGVLLSVPDDFAWALEFGALAELLSTDGLTRDPSRAKYAESLYALAVGAAKLNPSVLLTQLNNDTLYTGSFFDLDMFMSNWQNVADRPTYSAMGGRNLIAYAPVPDQIYGVSVDYAANMPVPTIPTDFLQVGREHLQAVLDLAQHLCAFKQGGAEFMDSVPLFQNFLRVVGVQNARLAATAFYAAMLSNPALEMSNEVLRIKEKSHVPAST